MKNVAKNSGQKLYVFALANGLRVFKHSSKLYDDKLKIPMKHHELRRHLKMTLFGA